LLRLSGRIGQPSTAERAKRPRDMTAKNPDQAATRPPRLYLVVPADSAGAAAALMPALAAGDVAAVLLRLPAADERTLINRIKEIAPPVQAQGVALLLDGRADLVARAGADGAHLSGIDAVKAAVSALKPERIVGAGGLVSRHDAMLAAEAGADYVMFGEPGPAGKRPSFEAIQDRVEWWTEVFEIPCVAHAENLAEVDLLGAAEFIALGAFVFDDPRGAAAVVAEATARLKAENPA
jgi:thiamine-phosphate pyrophosphorylase